MDDFFASPRPGRRRGAFVRPRRPGGGLFPHKGIARVGPQTSLESRRPSNTSNQGIVMSPEVGRKVIEVARSLIGSHYINGAYGATPGNSDGCPCRPGGIKLVADPNRLNPAKLAHPNQNLAVLAAEMNVKQYCVCAGNYATLGGKEVSPTDPELVA